MDATAIRTNVNNTFNNAYARCLTHSRKINWDIDRDVIRFRTLDSTQKFLPDSLSKVHELPFLDAQERIFLSQIQGRTYAYIFGLSERFINSKVLEMGMQHSLGDQTALMALLQFSVEEMKHQELFDRIEVLAAAALPAGYQMTADANEVARAVLSKSTWAVLGLTCCIEIFTQLHYKESIRTNHNLSPLFQDVFRFHWLEEAQHATLDELEWQRIHDTLTPAQIDQGVDDLIALVQALDGILQAQAAADAHYFISNCSRGFSPQQQEHIHHTMLKAYRWQYIVSGVQIERFQQELARKINAAQQARIDTALAPLLAFVTV